MPHNCKPRWIVQESNQDLYGAAIWSCRDRDGQFWVDNDEYASRVNYCPFCGEKAPLQVEESDEEDS